MRTSKTVSISMPPAQYKQVERLARKENRTISELIREAVRHYQQKREATINIDLINALRTVQEEARRAGLNKLSKREIDAEITAYREEQRARR